MKSTEVGTCMSLSLQKGESLSLTKQNGETLTNVRFGLGWDAAVPAKKGFFGGTKAVEIDLEPRRFSSMPTRSMSIRSSTTS